MSEHPFGFGPGSGDSGSGDSGSGGSGGTPGDPFGFGAMGDPAAMAAAFQRIGQLLSWTGGPVNWDLARDTARAAIAGSDPSPSLGDRGVVEQALRVADVWLDDVTALPAASGRLEAWSRAEWVERTLPAWKALVEPVAERVVSAMNRAMTDATGEGGLDLSALGGMGGLPGMGAIDPEALGQQLGGMVRAMSASMFGAQVGQALGALASEVVGSTDIGIPLGESGRAALLPSGVAEFAKGLEVPADEVRLYLALRESAHQRLFTSAHWLRSRLTAEIEAYAQGIVVDTGAIESAMGQLDPTDPAAMQDAIGTGLFDPEPTPAQLEALARLEALLALVEGWVDAVTSAAAEPHLKHAAALQETVRRRRATGGPAEQTFASLVGLELRPRRLRDAATLWRALRQARGLDGRDAVWAHPDLMPSAADLDSPAAFAAAASDGFDLETLLATEQSPEAKQGDGPDSGSPSAPDAG